MKILFTSILSLFLTISAVFAEQTVTNAPNSVENISTNFNAVVIDILRGVKNESAELYKASKSAIIKSIDFTMEQTPLVVKEFLRWHMARAIIYLAIYWMITGLLVFWAYWIHKFCTKEGVCSDDVFFGTGAKYILLIIAGLIFCNSTANYGSTIAKISVAPRVYMIEYVADLVSPTTPSRHTQ